MIVEEIMAVDQFSYILASILTAGKTACSNYITSENQLRFSPIPFPFLHIKDARGECLDSRNRESVIFGYEDYFFEDGNTEDSILWIPTRRERVDSGK